MAMFWKGQVLKALKSSQGLEEGKQYIVTEVYENQTPFGVFVAYVVEEIGVEDPAPIGVINAHLIMEGDGKEQ